MVKLTIPAKDFRRFNDPIGDTPDGKPVKYRFYAKVKDVPEELLDWMDTNPREQNLDTAVSTAIRLSLLDDANPRFHLWNRGILISASRVTFDNRKKKEQEEGVAEIELDDYRIHGNIDGGHTLRIILECSAKAKNGELKDSEGNARGMPHQYVDIEVITGLDSPDALAEARNTSEAVDLKSMEELRNSFEVLKGILEDCTIEGDRYLDRIEFKQNQMKAAEVKNAIDIREIISIINMYNQKLYPIDDYFTATHPIQSFSGKEVGLRRFLRASTSDGASDQERREARNQLLHQMAPIIPDIFRLWDYIERNFTKTTLQIGKRYGAKSYSNKDKKKRQPALFSNAELRYTIPKGIMYPLVGAFRALVNVDASGMYSWIADPIQAWEDLKVPLTGYVMSTSDELANNPANIGRSPNLWNSLFKDVSYYATRHRSAST